VPERAGDIPRSKEKIRGFILERVSTDVFGNDEDIFEAGLVSSMFVMELVLFVEQQFGIVVGGEDLDMNYFRSVDAVTSLVHRKLAA